MAKARRRSTFDLAEVPSDELINEIKRRNEAVICVVWNPGNQDDGPLNVTSGFSAKAAPVDRLDIVEMMMKDVVPTLTNAIERGDI